MVKQSSKLLIDKNACQWKLGPVNDIIQVSSFT